MAAETFLRDYVSYENCLGVNEMLFHNVKRYIEPVDLDTLLECSDLLEGLALLRGPAQDRVRVDVQSLIVPVSTN